MRLETARPLVCSVSGNATQAGNSGRDHAGDPARYGALSRDQNEARRDVKGLMEQVRRPGAMWRSEAFRDAPGWWCPVSGGG